LDWKRVMGIPIHTGGSRPAQPAPAARDQQLLALAVLAVAVFVAHFMRFAQFGFYEDDYWSVAGSVGLTARDVWARAQNYFELWPQGRPLNHLLPTLLGYVGGRLGGLEAMYALGAAWLVLNTWLVYRLALKLLPGAAALTAGVAYVLFPADTTRQLLIHVAHVQGAMTFSLVGLLLWRRGGVARVISYPVAGLSLLSFETAYIAFLCAPLILAGRAEFRRLFAWAVHAAGCSLVMGLVVLARVAKGGWPNGARQVLGKPTEAATRAVTSLYLGPLTDLRAFGHALVEGGRRVDLWAIASAAVLALLLLAWHLRRPHDAAPGPAAGLPGLLTVRVIALWAASYVFTLTDYPPTQLAGRLTSTHTAAALPVALLAGCVHAAIARRSRTWRRWSSMFVVAGLFLTLSYNQFVQREYVRMWRVQRDFWQQVIALSPDTDSSSTILVAGTVSPERSDIIAANSWADNETCRRLFGVDAAGNGPQFTHLGVLWDSVPFRRVDSGVEWKPQFWGGPYRKIDTNDLILLRSDYGRLSRVLSIDTPVGLLTTTRPVPSSGARRRTDTFLYHLIEPPQGSANRFP
jgi:hypothetical protein